MNLNEIVKFQVEKGIRQLYIGFLGHLDNFKDGKQIPSLQTHKEIRKNILDKSNDLLRDLEELFEQIEVKPKK
jgi:hypothetical protein